MSNNHRQPPDDDPTPIPVRKAFEKQRQLNFNTLLIGGLITLVTGGILGGCNKLDQMHTDGISQGVKIDALQKQFDHLQAQFDQFRKIYQP